MTIAVWGRDGIGKSTLCDALGLLFVKHSVIAVINTDLTQPTLPVRLNGFLIEPDASLGRAVSGFGTGDAAPFLHQHPKHKGLFFAGLVDGEDFMSYETGLDADDKAQDFVEQCNELAGTVILDVSGQRVDPFLPGALHHADWVIILFTPDVQGVCWFQSVAPLLHNGLAQGHVLPVAAMVEKHLDLKAVEKAAGIPFAATLPFVKEFRQIHDTEDFPLDGVTPSALRYQRQVRQLYERQNPEPQEKNAYESVLDRIRAYVSAEHAETLARSITEPSIAESVKQIIEGYIAKHRLRVDGLSMSELVGRLYGDMAGFGFLDKYICDPDIEEINGNSWRDVEIVTRSGWRKIPEHFLSPQHAEDTLRKMVRLGGLVLDSTNPKVDSYITEGVRISALIPPVTDRKTGAVFSLRRQRMAKVTKEQLVGWQTATPEMLDFLTLCINHGISVGFSGRTGSGKTTDISFLLNAVDPNKRIFTIEETRELDLFQTDSEGNALNRIIHTCTRPSELANANVDMNDLLREALRFSPDVIAVAEMRGAEALVAQESARTGHAVVTSLHANSARKAYGRILSMCQMFPTNYSTSSLLNFVVEAFPIMVFKRQFPDGTRRMMEIVEATGIADGMVQANTLFRFEMDEDGGGRFTQVSGISEGLADTLRTNGASNWAIAHFQEVTS